MPLLVSSEDPQVRDLVCVVVQPSGACLFESGVEHMTMSALDHAGTNRQTQCQCLGIVQAIQSIGDITMPIAHRGLLFRCADLVGRRTSGKTSGLFRICQEICQEASFPGK